MSQHIDSVKTYSVVWLSLLGLTALTTLLAHVDFGDFSVAVALTVAVVKTTLVALFFMHIRHSTKLTKLVVVGGLLWLAILILLTMADIVSRGWLGVPGK